MSKSDFPSIVTVGSEARPGSTVLEFLCDRFPKIPPSVWRDRMESGKVLHEQGSPAGMNDIALEGARFVYYREVENETVIPFEEKVLYADEHILAVDKPHFLPVVPAGRFVHETLLSRLKRSTGREDIAPLHRLDRATAGIVLFSINGHSRDAYYNLFRKRLVRKTYRAVSRENHDTKEKRWRVANRIVRGEPWFRMQCAGGAVNAVSDILLDRCDNGLCYFTLHPETGRKHQLRLHLSLLGYPVLNDRLYPDLLPEEADDFSKPLMLLAESIGFRDPVTGTQREFHTGHALEGA
jgi:tRNA pseudouridine32 synthase / 23S rRNA pseudouridine746 synthase